jgi:hypothetical protein
LQPRATSAVLSQLRARCSRKITATRNREAQVTSTLVSYQLLTRDMSRTLKLTAAETNVSRETAYYNAHIGNVKSIDDFLKDYRLFSYAMKAYGLEQMTYAKAFMRKVLTEGVATKDTFANKLSDTRYAAFAKVFDFARLGASATQTTAATTDTTQAYLRQTVEEDAGDKNEGVRLALYFERKAPDLNNVYEILADPALIKVVQTALGLSQYSSMQDVDQQAAYLKKRLNLDDFQDSTKLSKFIQRFCALYDIQNPDAATSSSTAVTAVSLISGASGGFSISASTLASIQNLKFGK